MERQQLDAAIKELLLATRLSPKSADAHNALGIALAAIFCVPVAMKLMRSEPARAVDVEKIAYRDIKSSVLASGHLLYDFMPVEEMFDVAEAVLFLLRARYVTGEEYGATGGRSPSMSATLSARRCASGTPRLWMPIR